MKLTKETLKRIIKEELDNAMDEGFMDMFRKKKVVPAEKPVRKTKLPPYKGGGNIEKLLQYIEMHYDQRDLDQSMEMFRRLGEFPPEAVQKLGNDIQNDKAYLGKWLSMTEDMLEREGR